MTNITYILNYYNLQINPPEIICEKTYSPTGWYAYKGNWSYSLFKYNLVYWIHKDCVLRSPEFYRSCHNK